MAERTESATCPFHNRICQIDCEALVEDEKGNVSCIRIDILSDLQELIASAGVMIAGIGESQKIPGFIPEEPENPQGTTEPILKLEETSPEDGGKGE